MSAPAEFAVWAPLPERVRIQVDGDVHDMTRDDGGWWRAEVDAAPEADYGFLLDDGETPRPDPRSRRQPEGVHGLSRRFDPDAYEWGDDAWTGRPLAGGVVYELHVGTFTPEGTLDAAIGRLGHLVAARRRLRRAAAGQRLQRHPQLGLRRRPLVRGAGVLRRAGGLPAVRRRLPPAGPRRDPGRRLQPPRPVGELPARVLPDLRRGRRQHLGQLDQPERPRLRRGAPLRHRQRADVAARHARRRAAAGRRARAGRRAGHPRAGGDGAGGRQAVGRRRPAAHPDRRERPQRPADGHAARRRRARAHRAVERRLPPLAALAADRRGAGLLRRLRRGRARRAGEGAHRRVLPRRLLVELPPPAPRAAGRHRDAARLEVPRLPAGPRPDRQPRRRRPDLGDPLPRPARRRRHAGADQPVHADALHGRGVGREHAMAVLHQPPRAGARQGDGRGPDRRVRRARLGRRRGARPAGPGDLRPVEARLVGALPRNRTSGCSPSTAR